MARFEIDELVIYQDGDRCEIGKVKRITEDGGVFVCFHSGTTATLTPANRLFKLSNSRCVPATTLGGGLSGALPRAVKWLKAKRLVDEEYMDPSEVEEITTTISELEEACECY